MSTIISFHRVTDFEDVEILSPSSLTQEENFSAQAKSVSHSDSKDKISLAVTLMKEEGFTKMTPRAMGRIFEAFRFTFREKMDLEIAIFPMKGLDRCHEVLAQARLFGPANSKPVGGDIEESSKLLRTINATASFVSSSIDMILSAPFKLAAGMLTR